MKKIRKLGVLTGGGDCPGLNAVIRAVVHAAIRVHGFEVCGILDGYAGLIHKNVRPLALGVRGTTEKVYASAMKAMTDAAGHPLILSFGGATTMGVTPENVRALARAARDFNQTRA